MQEMKTAVRLTGADAGGGGGVQHLHSSSIPTLTQGVEQLKCASHLPPFSSDTSKYESVVNSQIEVFGLALHSAECTEKKLSP